MSLDLAEVEKCVMCLILNHWLDFHNAYKTKDALLHNAPTVTIKNSAIAPDLVARRERFHLEFANYSAQLPHVHLHYYPRYCSDALIVGGYGTLVIPYIFFMFEILIEDKATLVAFLNLLKAKIESEFETLGDFLTYIHRFWSTLVIPLTSTEVQILELASRPLKLATRTFSQNIAAYAAHIDKSQRTIERAVRRMEQLGVFGYTMFVNYGKIGLLPYMMVWKEPTQLPEE